MTQDEARERMLAALAAAGVNGMTSYVTGQMRAELAAHRLRQVCNAGGVRVFRMAKPGTGQMTIDLAFIGERTVVTADALFGSAHGLVGELSYGFTWFAGAVQELSLCRHLLPMVLRDEIWVYDPTDAGWLCAIQQRFAELWKERVARIEAIVAGWEWVDGPLEGAAYLWVGGTWRTIVRSDGTWFAEAEEGKAESMAAAKEAARAAALRQAIEHPELWHCGEVEQ